MEDTLLKDMAAICNSPAKLARLGIALRVLDEWRAKINALIQREYDDMRCQAVCDAAQWEPGTPKRRTVGREAAQLRLLDPPSAASS
jgi:hypothetical protein